MIGRQDRWQEGLFVAEHKKDVRYIFLACVTR